VDVHEQGFVESFVRPSRRERISSLLANSRNRRKFTAELAHNGTGFLNPECLRSIQAGQQSAESIHAILLRLGAPGTCHIISEGDLDGKELKLSAALAEVVGGGMGTVISCVPGRLGYFEGEFRERYILQR